MNEIEYLHWLIADIAQKYPDLKWVMACVADSLGELNLEDIRHFYANECTDWDILKYCAFQSEQLNIEHNTAFVHAVFSKLSSQRISRTIN